MKELTYTQQLEILKSVKKYLTGQSNFVTGLCMSIGQAMKDILGFYALCDEIGQFIPSFNRPNAIALASKYGYKKPYVRAAYWWDEGSRKHRLAFINALITELEILNK